MSRFYVRPEDVAGGEILVSKKEAHHILDVMRLGTGDSVVAFDGTGKEFFGKIIDASKDSLRVKIETVEENKDKKEVFVSLIQAIPKKGKMDFIIEKATELGVNEIIPVVTERTIIRLKENKRDLKHKHWQDIAISAAKQCGRTDIPKIRKPVKFIDALKEARDYDLAIMACLNEETAPFNKVISQSKAKKIITMIGPEGDFSPGEISAAKKLGVKLVSFGKNVLRVETASIYILSVLNYIWSAKQ